MSALPHLLRLMLLPPMFVILPAHSQEMPAQSVHPAISELLIDLQARLPEQARLQRLSIADGYLELQGVSVQSSDLLVQLAQSPLLDQASVDHTQGNTANAFLIRAKLATVASGQRMSSTVPESAAGTVYAQIRTRLESELSRNDGESHCELLNAKRRTTVPTEVVAQFRMRCGQAAAGIVPLLASLERGEPLLTVSEFHRYQQLPTGHVAGTGTMVDIRFNVSASVAGGR